MRLVLCTYRYDTLRNYRNRFHKPIQSFNVEDVRWNTDRDQAGVPASSWAVRVVAGIGV